MQPMAHHPCEVESFLKIVNDRAQTIVQIETQTLVEQCSSLADLDWNYAYIGLAVVFGTGSIGLAIAKILNTDGIEVIGVKKTVQEESLPYFTALCNFNSCLEHLTNVDWCFLALPYTSETEGMFNEKENLIVFYLR